MCVVEQFGMTEVSENVTLRAILLGRGTDATCGKTPTPTFRSIRDREWDHHVALADGLRQEASVGGSGGWSYEYHSGNHAQGVACFELRSNGSYTLGNAKE